MEANDLTQSIGYYVNQGHDVPWEIILDWWFFVSPKSQSKDTAFTGPFLGPAQVDSACFACVR